MKEGGAAIKGVSKINQENVEATLEVAYRKLLPAIGIKKENTALLGSTGKKLPGHQSGDIDMAISISAILKEHKNLKTLKDVIDHVFAKTKTVVKDVRILPGIGIVTMGFPIVNTDGKQEGEKVQFDLMLTDNIKFAGWMYYSPHEKDSPYKGLYRNSMLSAISHYADREGDEEEWERYLLNFNKGLGRVRESLKGKRGLLKTPKVIERKIPIKDADKVVEILLGPSFKAKDILTFEDVFGAFMSNKFAWKAHRKEIAKRVADVLSNKGFPVPEKLAKVAGI